MEQTKKTSKKQNFFFSDRFSPCKLSKYFWMLSGTILLIGVILLCTVGFNLGISFTGGNMIEISTGTQIDDPVVYGQVQNAVESVLAENGAKVSTYQIVGSGEDKLIDVSYQNVSSDMTEINKNIVNGLNAQLSTILTDFTPVTTAQTVSASSSATLLMNSFFALAIAIVAILVYVAIRFELLSGLAAVITLFHDVLMMCALVLIFRIEVNSAFIAAVITILGYSVNNTIVVFDRVRENLKKETLKGKTNREIADISVKQTLTRTFNTSLTTILAVLMLAIIGVSAIREFIWPILFGLLVGTYAAIFISAPLWAKIITNSRFDRNKKEDPYFKIEKKRKTEDGVVVETTAELVK